MLGAGPTTLLFLHGWGGAGTGHSWRGVLDYLDLTGRRAILSDLRGHGRSEQPTHGFNTERFAADALAVADAAGAGELVVVAYSMSGKWAQWLACAAPERVVGQVLLVPVPAVAIPFPDETKEYWLRVARSGDRAVFEEYLCPFVAAPLPADVVDAYFYDVTHTSQVTLGATLDMCATGAFLDRLGATRAPTLVVGGAHDPMLGPDALREGVVARLPRARLVTLDCGHEIPLERSQQAAALIEAFLAGLGR